MAQIGISRPIESDVTITGSLNVARKTITVTTPSIAQDATDTGTVALGAEFVLLYVSASTDARVRLYTDAASRTADSSRALNILPSASAGVLLDALATGSVKVIGMAPVVVGYNGENPVTADIAYAIENKNADTQAVSIQFTYIPK